MIKMSWSLCINEKDVLPLPMKKEIKIKENLLSEAPTLLMKVDISLAS